jgi:hypothetical protein
MYYLDSWKDLIFYGSSKGIGGGIVTLMVNVRRTTATRLVATDTKPSDKPSRKTRAQVLLVLEGLLFVDVHTRIEHAGASVHRISDVESVYFIQGTDL